MTDFLRELETIAPAAGQGAYAFVDSDGTCRGWVQLILLSDSLVEIHRLWTLQPRKGNGSTMLRAVCQLSDRHGIALRLKALPFGRKPYPMDRQRLLEWYQRHGFELIQRKLIRMPRSTVG